MPEILLEGFSLAERNALLTDAELEEMAGRLARAEAVFSAYEGILLDEEQLKGGLLQVFRETRLMGTPAAA